MNMATKDRTGSDEEFIHAGTSKMTRRALLNNFKRTLRM